MSKDRLVFSVVAFFCMLIVSCASKNETIDGLENMIEYSSVSDSLSYISKVEKNKKAGEEFLEVNKLNRALIVTPTGLQYLAIKEGEGSNPIADSEVSVKYKCSVLDGSIIEDKMDESVILEINQQNAGLMEGLLLMNQGARYKFFLPYKLAKDKKQSKGNILPYSVLIYEVELVYIVK